MNSPAKNAGTASAKFSQSISLNAEVIITPTTTSAGAVAAMGTALTKVARKALMAKQMATTTLVRPVRPPAPIPEALSTKVVVLEVPKIAPMEVAVASANRALSILDLKPELVSMASSSSALKMPARRPVPMKVPMVSKVSEMLKAKMVISTRGSFARSVNRDGRPSAVKIAQKVVGRAAQASVKLTVSAVTVTPIGIPMMAVTTMPIRIAPFTLQTRSTMVRTRPIKNSQKAGWFSVAMAGTPDSKVMMPTFRRPI